MGGLPPTFPMGSPLQQPYDPARDLARALEPFLQQQRELLQQQQEKAERDLVDREIKVLSASFDKAVAYTNVIVIAGYGGFFGLWSLTRGYLTATEARYAGLSMLASASIFVGFEVFKMIGATFMLRKRAEILQNPKAKTDRKELAKRLDEHEKQFEYWNVYVMRAWWIQVIGAVIPALLGIGILYSGLVRGLL